MKTCRAFTLIELLVAIGIIVMLLAILLPVVGRVKYESGMARCASDEAQYVAAALSYAHDNNGFLPRIEPALGTGVTTGTNPHDMSYAFYKMMLHYGLPHRSFFCPFTDERVLNLVPSPGSQFQQGYAWWVPRSNTSPATTLFPPDPPSVNVVGNQIIHGPVSLTDPIGKTNPVLTDDVYLSLPVANPATYNVGQAPPTAFFPTVGDNSHLYHGVLDALNEAFIDGHVERVPATEVHCIYQSGNAFVCR